jgi:hypothetical protein
MKGGHAFGVIKLKELKPSGFVTFSSLIPYPSSLLFAVASSLHFAVIPFLAYNLSYD